MNASISCNIYRKLITSHMRDARDLRKGRKK